MTDISSSAVLRSERKLAGGLPYIFTIFLSAGLVFLVQPMFARMALPVLGGSSSVWNVSLVCFQAALLGGYIYAHLLVKLKNVLYETIVHGGFLLLAASVLPLGLTDALGAPYPDAPATWLIGVFALSIAPAFAIISATAPLIQSWYSRSGRHDAADPYHLYAASNVGSLIGLVAYPVLMEPLLSLANQTMSWSIGYGVLAIGLSACGVLAWKTGQNSVALPMKSEDHGSADAQARNMQRLKWLALAFVPSSLLVGTTTHITTDIGSAPFLWAPPLMIYIASFVVVFSSGLTKALRVSTALLPLAIMGVFFLMLMNQTTSWFKFAAFGFDLLTLALAAIVCHGVMADTRPQASRLTEFYLIMSFGGVLGGAFNALVAPVIFSSALEYPIMLVAVLLARPLVFAKPAAEHRFLLLAACLVGLMIVLGRVLAIDVPAPTMLALALVPGVVLVMMRDHLVPSFIAGFALCVTALNATTIRSDDVTTERSFFGIVQTMTLSGIRVMMHGTTLHGAQINDQDGRPEAITYYHPTTPMGQAFATFTEPENVGVIGLGVGATACLMRDGQKATYFEIDPLVAEIATDPTRFTYLSECGENMRIVLGDGRLTLQNDPEGAYDLLLIDAFSSDAIPVHLLTVEAFEGYFSRLSEDGVLIAHISNRHVDLQPILGRLAEHMGLEARVRTHLVGDFSTENPISSSIVVALGRKPSDLGALIDDERWVPLESDGKKMWTDDYSNLLGAIVNHMFDK